MCGYVEESVSVNEKGDESERWRKLSRENGTLRSFHRVIVVVNECIAILQIDFDKDSHLFVGFLLGIKNRGDKS